MPRYYVKLETMVAVDVPRFIDSDSDDGMVLLRGLAVPLFRRLLAGDPAWLAVSGETDDEPADADAGASR